MPDKYQKDRILTTAQAMKSIYLGFEGEHEKANGKFPLPHMLGVYTPEKAGQLSTYRAFLFRQNWQPLASGAACRAQTANLEETLERLIARAQQKGGYLISFGHNAEQVVRRHCPQLYDAFSRIYLNAKPLTDRLYNHRYPKDTAARPDSLQAYAGFYFPGLKMASLYHGVSYTCRRLDCAAERSRLWQAWEPRNQSLAEELLAFNQSECQVTWQLTRKLTTQADYFRQLQSAA